jgi:DnaJ-class molecular chaperone
MGLFSDRKVCPDCDGMGFGNFTGDGQCSACHGTGGELNVIEAVADILAGESQECKVCGGSGVCQTCNGEGEI